jgi:hypothetical protein
MPIFLILAGLAIVLFTRKVVDVTNSQSVANTISTGGQAISTTVIPTLKASLQAEQESLATRTAAQNTGFAIGAISANAVIPGAGVIVAAVGVAINPLVKMLYGKTTAESQSEGVQVFTAALDNIQKTGIMSMDDAKNLERGRVLMQTGSNFSLKLGKVYHLEDFEDWGFGGLLYTAERVIHGHLPTPYQVTEQDVNRFPPPSSAATSAAIVDAVNGKV